MAKVSDFVQKRTVIDIDASKIKELCLNGEFTELSGLALPLCNDEERKKLSKNNQTAKEINDKIEKILKDETYQKFSKIVDEAEEERDKLLHDWAKKTVKKMREKNISIEYIAGNSNMTPDDVKALLK